MLEILSCISSTAGSTTQPCGQCLLVDIVGVDETRVARRDVSAKVLGNTLSVWVCVRSNKKKQALMLTYIVKSSIISYVSFHAKLNLRKILPNTE